MTLRCTMILGDCLDVMPTLPRASVQMAFCDLPYTRPKKRMVTQHAWDIGIDPDKLWPGLRRIGGRPFLSVFTAQIPLAAQLYASNSAEFLYDLVWHKTSSATFLQAKRRPMCFHEMLLVFRRGQPIYNPIMRARPDGPRGDLVIKRGSSDGFKLSHKPTIIRYGEFMYPSSVIAIPSVPKIKCIHPTEKPVALTSWLIRTYSNAGDTVLDPVAGSFTTCVSACLNGRSSVGIERCPEYFNAGVERVRKTIHDGNIDAKVEVRT